MCKIIHKSTTKKEDQNTDLHNNCSCYNKFSNLYSVIREAKNLRICKTKEFIKIMEDVILQRF